MNEVRIDAVKSTKASVEVVCTHVVKMAVRIESESKGEVYCPIFLFEEDIDSMISALQLAKGIIYPTK
jgi:hypothetical protein